MELLIATVLSLVFVETAFSKMIEEIDWSNKAIKEHGCMKCACKGDPIEDSHSDSVVKILAQKTYVTMGSRKDLAWAYLLLQGREPASNEDIDRTCLSATLIPERGQYYQLGGGVNVSAKIGYKAGKISVYNFEQKYDPIEVARPYHTSSMPQRCTIVWTDGVHHVLGTCCHWNGETSWFLASTKKTLKKKVARIVTKKVVSLGFDISKAYSPDFGVCYD